MDSYCDIASIESKFGGRTREKLMHALYKWRYMVPLSEYKIANLVMALRSSGLAKTAGKYLQDMLTKYNNSQFYRTRNDFCFNLRKHFTGSRVFILFDNSEKRGVGLEYPTLLFR